MIRWAVSRPAVVWAASVAICLGGAVSFTRLALATRTTVELPRLQITATWQGASAELVEMYISSPVEAAAQGVRGVRRTNSESRDGSSRITAELVSARPIHISFIDGIETMTGGEGPWIRGPLEHVKPGVLVLGTNPVTTDSVATAVMGYDPRAPKGVAPFVKCDNTLLLAEQLGVGTTDLKNIEVAGARIADVRFPFPV